MDSNHNSQRVSSFTFLSLAIMWKQTHFDTPVVYWAVGGAIASINDRVQVWLQTSSLEIQVRRHFFRISYELQLFGHGLFQLVTK